MGVSLAICQCAASDDVYRNLETIRESVRSVKADMYLFPELFLTGYGCRSFDGHVLSEAAKALADLSRNEDVALAVGMPVCASGKVFNSLMFFTPGSERRYDKLYLANFSPYDEGVFAPGIRPVMVEWKGLKIGLEVCYDVMFPEIHRHYAVKGADLVLVASASAEKSRYAMETVVPARSFENTVYTAFCNNIGDGPAGRFYGGSAIFSPLGQKIDQLGDSEGVVLAYIDPDEIASARSARHHLEDLRGDIDWS